MTTPRTESQVREATRRLQALHNRLTCYEILLSIDEDTYLLGYRLNASRGEMLEMIRKSGKGQEIINKARITDKTPFGYTRRGGWKIGDRVRVYRGRTERQAIIEGEYSQFS